MFLFLSEGGCFLGLFVKILAVAMATSTAGATGWYKGRVKAVTSGDCLVIMAITTSKPGPPPEKTVTLASLMAPKLVTFFCLRKSCLIVRCYLKSGFM